MSEIRNELPKPRKTFYTVTIKRFLDIVLSGFALIVLSPLLLIVSILVLVFHGKPIIYQQERPGLNGKIFNIYKFRTMTNETDGNGELLHSSKRITRLGRILRKYSIDELPELWCIFTGKMSIIGPRPLRVEYLPMYSERHQYRHCVRPGLACVSLKPGNSWTWNDQFENDIFYIENMSFKLDVLMIFAVVLETLHPKKYRTEATRSPFNGSNLDE